MITKHNLTGYRKGCRCDICKSCRSEYKKSLRPKQSSLKLDPAPLLAKLEASDQLHLLDKHSIYSWQKRGGINVYYADKWALKFGWHPAEVWGMAFYEGCFDGDN